ncbi:MAG: 3-hydroxyacyl-ACP dehydratase FabZ, partial [Cetobacterium sp.]
MLDVMEIMKRIPHRYPFLLVDRILEMDVEGQKIRG